MQRVFFGIFTVIKDQSWTVLYNLLAITGKTILPFSVSRTWSLEEVQMGISCYVFGLAFSSGR